MYIYPRLLVDKFDECLEFYTGTLGLTPRKVVPHARYASFEFDSKTGFALFDRRAIADIVGTEGAQAAEAEVPSTRARHAQNTPAPHPQDTIMLVVPVPDVDALMDLFPAESVVAPPADRPGWGLRSAYLRDPDGNLLELASARPSWLA